MATDNLMETLDSHGNLTPAGDPVAPTDLTLSSMTITQLKHKLLGKLPGVSKKKRSRPGKNKRLLIRAMLSQKVDEAQVAGAAIFQPSTNDIHLQDLSEDEAQVISPATSSSRDGGPGPTNEEHDTMSFEYIQQRFAQLNQGHLGGMAVRHQVQLTQVQADKTRSRPTKSRRALSKVTSPSSPPRSLPPLHLTPCAHALLQQATANSISHGGDL